MWVSFSLPLPKETDSDIKNFFFFYVDIFNSIGQQPQKETEKNKNWND